MADEEAKQMGKKPGAQTNAPDTGSSIVSGNEGVGGGPNGGGE